MIEVNETIDVPSDAKTVWDLLSNPRAVVECVSGATLGEQLEDGSYDAGIVVKFGPAKVAFKAKVAIELDQATRSGKVTSRGKDNQGGARFHTSMAFKVEERKEPAQAQAATPSEANAMACAAALSAGSLIQIQAQVDISGRLASLIETGASMVVKRMTKEFSEQVAARVGGTKAAP